MISTDDVTLSLILRNATIPVRGEALLEPLDKAVDQGCRNFIFSHKKFTKSPYLTLCPRVEPNRITSPVFGSAAPPREEDKVTGSNST